jgi:hypothetical protein
LTDTGGTDGARVGAFRPCAHARSIDVVVVVVVVGIIRARPHLSANSTHGAVCLPPRGGVGECHTIAHFFSAAALFTNSLVLAFPLFLFLLLHFILF